MLSSSSEGDVGRLVLETQPVMAVAQGDGDVNLAAAFLVPNDTDEIEVGVILAREPKAMRTARSKAAAHHSVTYRVR